MISPPQTAVTRTVAAADLDRLGHVEYLTYQRWADEALLQTWHDLNLGTDFHSRAGEEFVTVEAHVRYLSELRLGDEFTVLVRIPAFDDKRFVAVAVVSGSQNPVCIVETLALSFHLGIRRVRPWSATVRALLESAASRDAALAVTLLSGTIRLPPPMQS
jgi:acyl-CoA thioester hydrolase